MQNNINIIIVIIIHSNKLNARMQCSATLQLTLPIKRCLQFNHKRNEHQCDMHLHERSCNWLCFAVRCPLKPWGQNVRFACGLGFVPNIHNSYSTDIFHHRKNALSTFDGLEYVMFDAPSNKKTINYIKSERIVSQSEIQKWHTFNGGLWLGSVRAPHTFSSYLPHCLTAAHHNRRGLARTAINEIFVRTCNHLIDENIFSKYTSVITRLW